MFRPTCEIAWLHLAFYHFLALLTLKRFAWAQSGKVFVWYCWTQKRLSWITPMCGSSSSNRVLLCCSWFDSQVHSGKNSLLTSASSRLLGGIFRLDRPCFSFCVWISHPASRRSRLYSLGPEWRSCCFSSGCHYTFQLLSSIVASVALILMYLAACVWTSGCTRCKEKMHHSADS